MNKTAIKNFAIWARNKLITDIQYRAGLMGITADGIKDPLPQSTGTMEFYDIGTSEPYAISGEAISQRKKLVEIIRKKEKDSNYATAYKYILEEVAYTWFNRLIAIRFMEVNDYLPSHIRVLSSESGKIEPDLVTTPFDAELSLTTEEEQTILRLKNENKLDELFRLLFIKQCNALRSILPKLFERPEDYTELLLNLSVVDKEGVIYHLVHDIDENDFNIEKNGQVEIIGWLYQYYISERHDQIINIYKGTVKTEDVPAATQLFTTDWVVQYMVDNSLGKYWIERNPQSSLRVNLKYLAVPKDGTIPHIDEKVEPQSLTFFDPCMGSGHILIYAFDVLMDIYEECGYSTRDAASEIIRHNLFGLDIDPRAYQLAYFSLMMKARQYDRRFFTREIEPQIYCPKSESDLVRFGSLVQVDTLEEKPQEPTDLTLFNMNYEDILNDWNFRRLLAQKYAAVCTNPPYLNKYNPQLKDYVIENYKDYSGDLFSVFIYRNLLLCQPDGYCGFMTPFVWMFIKTYEKLREFIINNKSITSLIQMEYSAFEEATVPICSFVLQNKKSNEPGLYFRLSDFKGGMEVQRKKVLEAIANPDCGYFYEAQQSNFSKIPGSPVAYWVSDRIFDSFCRSKVDSIAFSDGQILTGDNEKYLRMLWEVEATEVRKDGKWMLHAKGGEFRKWAGNLEWVVKWSHDAIEHYKHDKIARFPKEHILFRRGVTWSLVSTNPTFGARLLPESQTFNKAAATVLFYDEKYVLYVLALLNSSVINYLSRIINPTLNNNIKDILAMPFIYDSAQAPLILKYTDNNIESSQADWNAAETSWDFKRHPLIRSISCLSDAYAAWKDECEQRFLQLKANEEELNRIFIEIYGLQDELTPEVADKDVTVHRIFDTKDDVPESMQGSNYVRTKRDEIVSLLSYAVGCMFGRYSLDRQGLVFAGGNFDSVYWKFKGQAALNEQGDPIDGGYAGISLADYHYPKFHDSEKWEDATSLSYEPDADGIIPITDEEYLEDDIVSCLCDWLKAVYGADTLEENLDFIAVALGGKGNSSREIIRNYFLKDFFKDHCKTY